MTTSCQACPRNTSVKNCRIARLSEPVYSTAQAVLACRLLLSHSALNYVQSVALAIF